MSLESKIKNLTEAKKKKSKKSPTKKKATKWSQESKKEMEEKGTTGSLTSFALEHDGINEKTGDIKKAFLKDAIDGKYGVKVKKKAVWMQNIKKKK